MKISSNNNNNNDGFTLIELVVVIAGLAALSSFTIPNFLNSIKLNKIEEAKAIMNGYASDCLGKFRISSDPVDFIENSAPDELDNLKLSSIGYKIDGSKNKCSHLAIKPINKNEKDYFAFDFRMSSEGLVLKTAIPSSNPRFLNSCRGWAGKNCGLSEAQKAEFARLAALAKSKSKCLSNYNKWLSAGNSGQFKSWSNISESCTLRVFAFEGIPVNSLEAVDAALKNKYGRACMDWRQSKKSSRSVSPNGNPQTKNPECGGVKYWYHSGKEFTNKSDWNEYNNQVKKQACIRNRSNALRSRRSGKYTYGPSGGPAPCDKTVWLCDGKEYGSWTDYTTTRCGAPPPPPPPPPPPTPPVRVPCRQRPQGCNLKIFSNLPACSCR